MGGGGVLIRTITFSDLGQLHDNILYVNLRQIIAEKKLGRGGEALMLRACIRELHVFRT